MAKKKEKQQPEESNEQNQKEGELLETLQRVQAEFENYKKRTAIEQEAFKQRAGENILKELLPLMDNFSLALKNNTEETEFSKGIELIYAQLTELLASHGVKKTEALNTAFNPAIHEALMTKKQEDKENNVILEVMQEGYTIHGRVLRSAKVIVNKK